MLCLSFSFEERLLLLFRLLLWWLFFRFARFSFFEANHIYTFITSRLSKLVFFTTFFSFRNDFSIIPRALAHAHTQRYAGQIHYSAAFFLGLGLFPRSRPSSRFAPGPSITEKKWVNGTRRDSLSQNSQQRRERMNEPKNPSVRFLPYIFLFLVRSFVRRS